MLVHEIFYSLQGEGLLVGVPSVFIRAAGCNLRCRWCDTKYASNREALASAERLSPADLLERVAKWPAAHHVVLTGGEPTLSPDLVELTDLLHRHGYHITIETNATQFPAEGLVCDLASLSPKLRNAGPQTPPIDIDCIRTWISRSFTQLKFVFGTSDDVDEILSVVSQVSDSLPADRVLLMPLTEPGSAEIPPEVSAACVKLCLERGFRFADRLHLRLFQGRRGF